MEQRGLQNSSGCRRGVERGPHFTPTLKFQHFSTHSLPGFKGRSPTSKCSVSEVLPRLLERNNAKLERVGFLVAVAIRMELQEVTANSGMEHRQYQKLYILHMLDGNTAFAKAVQAHPLLKSGTDNSKGESLTLILVCLACALSRPCILSQD